MTTGCREWDGARDRAAIRRKRASLSIRSIRREIQKADRDFVACTRFVTLVSFRQSFLRPVSAGARNSLLVFELKRLSFDSRRPKKGIFDASGAALSYAPVSHVKICSSRDLNAARLSQNSDKARAP